MALTLETILNIAGLEQGKLVHSAPGYKIVEVIARDGFGESKSNLLYLESSASYGQLPDVARKAYSIPQGVQRVIVSSSAKIAMDVGRIQNEFPKAVVVTARQLLQNSIRKRSGVALPPASEVFLNPTIAIGVESTPHVDSGLAATTELINWLNAPIKDGDPHIGVLLAPPGVGKTTVSERVASELAANGKLPVLVSSDRWARLSAIGDISLWDVWQSALTADGYVGLSDENTFSACVSEGILIPIFDGFDELCIQRSDHFRAHEVFSTFENLLANESGKILITVRDSYWREYIPKEIRDRAWVSTLFPFNKQQVVQYFENSFKSPAQLRSKEHALGLLKALQAALPVDDGPNWRKSILGVPAIINLIREASAIVKQEGDLKVPQVILKPGEAVDWILEYLCERERTRRLYHAPATNQIDMFTSIAIDFGDRFRKDTLELYRTEFLPELAAYSAEIDALTSHPFIQFGGQEYSFKYALVPEHVTGKWLISELVGLPKREINNRTLEVLERHSKGVDSFLEKVAEGISKEPLDRQVEIISSAFTIIAQKERGLGKRSYARSGLFHLVLAIAEHKDASGPRADRVREILRLMGLKRPRFEDLVIEGTISNLEFSQTEFVGCTFKSSGFVRCKLSGVLFDRCHFEGEFGFDGESQNIKLEGGTLSVEAREAFQVVLKNGTLPFTREQQLDGIRVAISLFGSPGRFHPVAGRDKTRGRLGKSPIKAQIWSALLKSELITREDIGRGEEGALYHINPAHAQLISGFLRNGVVAGQIEVALKLIQEGLK